MLQNAVKNATFVLLQCNKYNAYVLPYIKFTKTFDYHFQFIINIFYCCGPGPPRAA